MNNYNIIEKGVNKGNGGYYAVFEYKNSYYYADVCALPIIDETECMIFLFDKESNQVSDWGELYCKRDIPVSEESLINCIEEFCSEQ